MNGAGGFPLLFSPIDIGGIKLRNRLMLTTHGGAIPSRRYVRYLEARAAGGVGLIAVSGAQMGVAHVSSVAGRFVPSYAGDFDANGPGPATRDGIAYYDEVVTPMLRERADAIHAHGAMCIGQIYHLGSYRDFDNFRPAVAPSVVVDEEDRHLPHALDLREIDELIVAFGHAVRRVRDAGMDGAEIHCAHGFLINEFLSPHANRRTDRYGGSFENRLRFLREVLEAAEQRAPGFPLGIRVNGDEMVPGGLEPQAVAEIVRALTDQLIYVNVSAGTASGLIDGHRMAYASPWLVPPGHNVAAAAEIKAAVDLPVIVAGRIPDPATAEQVLVEGSADVVGMVRALIADPELPNKAREGRAAEIRPCIGQNECHGFHGTRAHLVCAVNPAASREEELAPDRSGQSKRVVVIGGGPAGMEAARAAAERGAAVVLIEREGELGGQLLWVARLPGLDAITAYVDHQRQQLAALGVDVLLGVTADASLVRALAPALTVVATGATPWIPDVPGIGSSRVLTAIDLLRGIPVEGRRIVVVGGQDDHLPPLLVAQTLALEGREVEVISELLTPGQGVDRRTLHEVLKVLALLHVRLTPLTELAAITETGVRLRHHFTKQEREVEDVDAVVIAAGGWPSDALLAELRATGARVHGAGDCQSPRRIIHAVLDGARAASVL